MACAEFIKYRPESPYLQFTNVENGIDFFSTFGNNLLLLVQIQEIEPLHLQ